MKSAMRLSILLGASLLSGLTGCTVQHSKPNTIYMPDMVYSPAFKAQEEGFQKPPVKGTIPRGYQPYAYAANMEQAGKELKNPLHRTEQVLARGKDRYNTYCIVCHGAYGEGDGSIVPKYPKPPSLQSDKIRGYQDGQVYHVITMGQNSMPSYASQIDPADRWAVIHYLRALQRAKKPLPGDLKVTAQK